MAWWRDARFGLFIHWGLYAVPAGEWGESKNHAEWIRTTAKIPSETYNQLLSDFNPVYFNAKEWVRIAKNAGMKYLVITAKHHDGFCLWDSKLTDFDVMSTPYQKDLLKEISMACEKEGIKLGFYYSIMDWHHPDYLPRREWETERSSEGADYMRYVNYMKRQLKELLTDYGKISVLWFDGEWESGWTEEYGKDMYNYVRSLQPGIIINNRVGTGRKGMAGMTEEGEFAGDFGTPEQEIPNKGIPGLDWETCMTMNNHWGYNKYDKDFKSPDALIRKLIETASKGGNYLLNVGPTADGIFPQESVDRLRIIGNWMKINNESVYGTVASPLEIYDWGRSTMKEMKESTRFYLHVYTWPENGEVRIPDLKNEVIRSYFLHDPEEVELKFEQNPDIRIFVPGEPPPTSHAVIVLDVVGSPVFGKKLKPSDH